MPRGARAVSPLSFSGVSAPVKSSSWTYSDGEGSKLTGKGIQAGMGWLLGSLVDFGAVGPCGVPLGCADALCSDLFPGSSVQAVFSVKAFIGDY